MSVGVSADSCSSLADGGGVNSSGLGVHSTPDFDASAAHAAEIISSI